MNAMYSVTDLGSFQPYGINDLGYIAGSQFTSDKHVAGVRSPDGGFRPLETPPNSGSDADAINIGNLVVGQVSLSAQPAGNSHACLWDASGNFTDLGTLPNDDFSLAVAINVCGLVVGNSNSNNGNAHVFIWKKDGGMSAIAPLTGYQNIFVHGMNNLGQVVGYCPSATGDRQGYLWNYSDKSMIPLTPLVPGSTSEGIAINDRGEIAGVSDSQAVLWRNRKALDLKLLPGGSWSTPSAINFHSVVVGNGNNNEPGSSRAFIWEDGVGIRDLNDMIPPNSGWVLKGAVGVNLVGQIIGNGILNGDPHGFLLTPQSSH